MYFDGTPPSQRRPERPGQPDGSGFPEPVPGFRSLMPLDRDAAAVTELCEDASGRLAIVTVGHNPLALGRRIGYLDWLERLTGIAGHPYVADVLAGGVTAEHRPYLAVRAGVATLADRLREAGSAPTDVTRRLGVGLAEALSLAHGRALLHGAVRPAAVLIDEDGKPSLAGFDTTAPALGRPLRPNPYAAPELLDRIAAGRPATTTAGDVYSLATTLYVTLGGGLPWATSPGDPGQRRLPEIELRGHALALARAFHAALEPDPARRLSLADLRDVLTGTVLVGVDDPGQPVPDTVLGADGIRPVVTPAEGGTGDPAPRPVRVEPTAGEPAPAAAAAAAAAGADPGVDNAAEPAAGPEPGPAAPPDAPVPATTQALVVAHSARSLAHGTHTVESPAAPDPVPTPPPPGRARRPVASGSLRPAALTAGPAEPAVVPYDEQPRPGGRVWARRTLLVAGAALVVLTTGAAYALWPSDPPSSRPAAGGGGVEEAVPPSQSLGPGKTAAPPSSAAPSPSRSSASPTPSRSRTRSPSPTTPKDRSAGTGALAGRWAEAQPWEDSQSFLKFTSSGHMTLTAGSFTCYGRAQPWDTGGSQRTYQMGHNCNQSGYAVIVLSDDGDALEIHWSQDTADQYVRS